LDCAQWLGREGRVTLVSVVVMPDHVHMVIGLRSVSLPAVMHAFKGYVAHAIRQRKIWQEGYHDRGIRDEPGLRSLVEYCLHNPVRAGLVEDFHKYPYWWCRWEV
jgi:putative transposase